MSGSERAELIEAVERGDALRAQVLLDGGANPEACKVVTLKAKVKDNLVTDTVQAESALALAIIHGHDRIVAALVAKGANVNASILWKTSGYSVERTWKQRAWDTERWMWSYRFPNALSLALGRGGRMFKWDRRTTMDAPSNEGKLGINKRGASVILDSPQMPNDVREWHQHTTSPSVIEALLNGGAEVTEEIRQYAEYCGNLQVYEMISSHIRTTVPASDPPPYEPIANESTQHHSAPFEAHVFPAQNRETEPYSSTLAAAEARATSAESRATQAEARITTLQTENEALQRLISELEQNLATALIAKAKHGQVPTSGSAVKELRPPTSVEETRFAIRDYTPQADDELQLRTGDRVFLNQEFADGWGSGYNMSSHNAGTFPLSHVSRSSSSPPARYDSLPRNAINLAAPVDPLEPAGESSRDQSDPDESEVQGQSSNGVASAD